LSTAHRRAARAGIDALELAHGARVPAARIPVAASRTFATDAYGGSFDGRIAFPLEVFDAVRAAWPASRPLGVRLSCTDWVDGGWTLDQSIEFARVCCSRGAATGSMLRAAGVSPAQKIPLGPGYQVHLSREIRVRRALGRWRSGLITEPSQAQAIVASGDADLVAMARWIPVGSALGVARGGGTRRRLFAAAAIPAQRPADAASVFRVRRSASVEESAREAGT
jgi:2,4-dienoyl-CoA reductase-like NADH-dependent reductase (Old Yellow Enzyme family)